MRYIYVILTVLILSSVCNAESSPNTPPLATLPASPNTPAVVQPKPQPTKIQPTASHSDETIHAELDAYKEIVKAYQETLTTIKWAIGIIGTLVLALMGYALFKDKKEYENALEQAKEARNDAKEACKEARHWEAEAKQILGSIDKQVKEELENIKKQGKESAGKIATQAQTDMRISELWNNALISSNEGKYEEACGKYAEITDLRRDFYWAYINWGIVLRKMATSRGDGKFFEQACQKYEQAIRINSKIPDAYNTWAGTILYWAQLKIGTSEYESLLKQAEEKALKADSLEKGSGAYNLACVYALRKNKEECKRWLLAGQEAETLPPRDQAMKDKDLDIVRDEAWFKEIKWKGEK